MKIIFGIIVMCILFIFTSACIPTSTTDVQECQEIWQCNEWDVCMNDIQTRMCFDINECGNTTFKPSETNVCGQEKHVETYDEVNYKDPQIKFAIQVLNVMIEALNNN